MNFKKYGHYFREAVLDPKHALHVLHINTRAALSGYCGLKVKYRPASDDILIHIYPTYENRSVKTAQMVLHAIYQSKDALSKKRGGLDLWLSCEDRPPAKSSRRGTVLAYSTVDGRDDIIPIPDFIFWGWAEAGIPNYDEIAQRMVEASKKPPEYDTLFWIGSNTHPTRRKLCELSESDGRIEAYMMSWKRDRRKLGSKNDASKYVSLIDHTKYKYLIDIQGNGYSGRTKLLMFSGRPLFLVDRKWKEYWYKDIDPFVHYIPVKEDLSDLIEKLDWAEANPEKAKAIAKNAQRFAQEHLTSGTAVRELANIFLALQT